MAIKTLVIGAGGTIGYHIMKELDANPGDLDITYTSIFPEEVEKWTAEGRKAIIMDLNNVDDIAKAVDGMERVFLLTTYSSDMLVWSYHVVDLAKKAGVKFIVHSGTYTCPDGELEMTPHFMWHRLIEAYIAQSGLAWCNVHPNNIIDTGLKGYGLKETKCMMTYCGDGGQGIVWASDIAAVETTVLREGPDKHNQKDYYLSSEVVTPDEMVETLCKVTGENYTCKKLTLDDLKNNYTGEMPTGFKYYGESAVYYMYTVQNNLQPMKLEVRDDCLTVLGRKGKNFEEGLREFLPNLAF